MASQMMKNQASHLGLFLVLGLLAGQLFSHPAVGALGGLICHLLISGLYGKQSRSGDSSPRVPNQTR